MNISDFSPSGVKPFTQVQKIIKEPAQANQAEGMSQTFGDVLKKAMEDLTALEKDSSTKINEMASGKLENVHDLMIAMEKSKLGLGLAIEVRNKIIEGYKEIMRMQL
ncbi:MAG TPA: flagellar hook-basal body complex protein FliE [Candidatus Wallbacteria bacterium]|nr:flagellar hook-basal body complex protein FliE [Candidatus Wallbacteria bacterium]